MGARIMFTYVKNAKLYRGKEHVELLGVAYRRKKANRDADSFWIIPGTLDLN